MLERLRKVKMLRKMILFYRKIRLQLRDGLRFPFETSMIFVNLAPFPYLFVLLLKLVLQRYWRISAACNDFAQSYP